MAISPRRRAHSASTRVALSLQPMPGCTIPMTVLSASTSRMAESWCARGQGGITSDNIPLSEPIPSVIGWILLRCPARTAYLFASSSAFAPKGFCTIFSSRLRSRQHHPANFGGKGFCLFERILHVGRVHGDSGLEVSHSPSCSRDRKRR